MLSSRSFNPRLVPPDARHGILSLLTWARYTMTHLDWQTPEAWLGAPAVTVCAGYDGDEVVAAMAADAPDDGVCWLRLLAVGKGVSISRAIRQLWSCLAPRLRAAGAGEVCALALADWAHRPLLESGFEQFEEVILLERPPGAAMPPLPPRPEGLRVIAVDDERLLEAASAVDRAAFTAQWRLSAGDLRLAREQAVIFLLAELDGMPAGYAIATAQDGEAHLARLATAPAFQRRGVAAALLGELIPALEAARIPLTTVNTQRSNLASRRLYTRWGFVETGLELPVLAAVLP